MITLSQSAHKSCPQNSAFSTSDFHSTDPRWLPNNHGERLLAFLEELILDLARNHPSVTKQDVAVWLAPSLLISAKELAQLGPEAELRVWRKKAALAKEVLARFPDCPPAMQFLERFKEKFGYEYGL